MEDADLDLGCKKGEIKLVPQVKTELEEQKLRFVKNYIQHFVVAS